MVINISKIIPTKKFKDLIENLLITKRLLMILIGSVKVEMQGAIQNGLNHSISVTINILMKLQKNW